MEKSKEVGLVQQEIDALFERLEVATEKDDEIVARYELKLQEIDEYGGCLVTHPFVINSYDYLHVSDPIPVFLHLTYENVDDLLLVLHLLHCS